MPRAGNGAGQRRKHGRAVQAIRGNSGFTLPPSSAATTRRSSGLARVAPRVLVAHLLPRRREVEAAIDRLRRPRQERLEQDRRDSQRAPPVEQHPVRRLLVGLDQLPRLVALRRTGWPGRGPAARSSAAPGCTGTPRRAPAPAARRRLQVEPVSIGSGARAGRARQARRRSSSSMSVITRL